jgi:hypothetical protein
MSKPTIIVPCVLCGAERLYTPGGGVHRPSDRCYACSRRGMARPLAERFEEKVARGAGGIPPHRPELGACDLWMGSRGKPPKDYGDMHYDGATIGAHVVAFFLHWGRWPEPCCLHLCDRPRCVRWDHLFEGTIADNNVDMIAKGRRVQPWPAVLNALKTHCPAGHPYEGENLIIDRGSRVCRECGRKHARDYQARKRAEGSSR